MRDTIEAIKDSPLWSTLTLGEKLDALLYAVGSAEETMLSRYEHVDVSDIVGEIFADYNN
ncbi:MAG: hypothetical protein WA610_08915 [Thermodesulfovibrionales bacterium]